MDLLAGLNDAQRQAVLHDTGPLAVLAGPGTGKTKLIVHRLAHMIVERNIDPATIAALTFTVKAAAEMRQRLADLLTLCGPEHAPKAALVNVHTYHGLGRLITWRFADRLKLPANLRLADAPTLHRLAREVITHNNLMGLTMGQGADAAAAAVIAQAAAMSNAAVSIDHARAFINQTTADLKGQTSPEALGKLAECQLFAQTTDAVAALRAEQARLGYIGFDELITLPIDLLTGDHLARDVLRGELRHAVVDEFQDVNTSTIVLLAHLFPHNPSTPTDLCVVGDDDQAIYAFRGADEHAFARFAHAWPGARTITLDENYRSAQPVLAAASRTISLATSRAAPDKSLRAATSRPPDHPSSTVRIIHTKDDAEVAEAIAATLITSRAAEPALPWSSYAVLARTRGELDRVHAALELEGIPVRRRRRAGTMTDDGVQDLLAWSQLLIDPTDSPAARRLLQRPPIGIDPPTIIELEPRYRALIRRHRLDTQDPDSDSATEQSPLPPYLHWLTTQRPDDARLARARQTFDHFHHLAATTRADQLIYDLAIHTGVVHADLLPPAQRAARLDAVVQLVRFAQQRQPTLPKPGDLAQLLDLLSDFDDNDELGIPPSDRVDDDPNNPDNPDDAADDAVILLTAHASKGLEFDTVILPRVSPPHGYPSSKGPNAPSPIPAPLHAGLHPSQPPADHSAAARQREERRIFYVACTRAKRRLILVGKKPPKKSDAVQFTAELLTHPPAAPDPITADALLSKTPTSTGELRRQLAGGKALLARHALTAELAAGTRASAAAALASVESPTTTPDQLDAATTSLRRAAERLALIATLAQGLPAPTWANADDIADINKRLGPQPTASPAPTPTTRARKRTPPLHLSFTKLDAYLRCPACYYCRYELGLEEPTSAELSTGDLVHKAMERFGKLCQHADAEGNTRPPLHMLHKVARDLLLATTPGTLTGEAALLAQITAQLTSAHTLMHRRPANILLVEQKVNTPYTHAGEHTLTAKLDRVDQLPDGTFCIIDYKTGKAWSKLLEPETDDLQLGIYALSLQHHLSADEPLPGLAEYQLLATTQVGAINLADLDLHAVRATINDVIDNLLAGNFDRKPNCQGPCRMLAPQGGERAK
ncbi:MAG: UvrD-helicase domain-containing protein [bacterium]